MFNIFVWRWDAILLDTYSDHDLAEKALSELKKIDTKRKMWIEPVTCRNNIEYTIEKFKEQVAH